VPPGFAGHRLRRESNVVGRPSLLISKRFRPPRARHPVAGWNWAV